MEDWRTLLCSSESELTLAGAYLNSGLVWFSPKEARSLNLSVDLRPHFEGEVDLAGEVVA